MPDLYRLARPMLWRLPPERAHRLALWTLRAGLGHLVTSRKARRPDPPALAQFVWGLRFRNPIGIAAGFDKDGPGLHTWGALGFGFAEVGTVTAHQQPGNPRPRLFRLQADRALLNRMGFNNHGADQLAVRLRRTRADVPTGTSAHGTAGKLDPHGTAALAVRTRSASPTRKLSPTSVN